MTDRPANRLARESSPYLLQHAHNPVDWFPWGSDAFDRARSEDRPIFLSVGYAACHWCHVMERESFEDDETARVLNDRFVAIKVDREERPDVDALYMTAVQAMNDGRGGWPMSVFLTPEGEPFFAGTYYPNEPRFGSPSFLQVLEAISVAWRDRRVDLAEQGARVTAALSRSAELLPSKGAPDQGIIDRAYDRIRAAFDLRAGGLGSAPKFPQPMTLEFLLRMSLRGRADALDMVTLTLDRMAAGGIRDQLGGGFSRYSTDASWHVPHFEKMLYDNAQLAQLYTRAWLVTGIPRYRTVATGVLDELLREMRQPEGGFCSSQDADSEGVEGKYFTWSWSELLSLVGEDVARAFGATPEGNWQPEPGRPGTNVLWQPVPIQDLAAELELDLERLRDDVEEGRRVLFEARASRVRPGVDDKVVTGWNALAIRALVDAGRAFAEPRFVVVAEQCAGFLWEHLRDGSGRLLRSWRHGISGPPGYADDHALFVLALLAVYEATGEATWFARASETAEALLELFRDPAHGGFFQVGSDAERLVVRSKDLSDDSVPSGNSAAAEAFLRLSMYTGEARHEAAAIDALRLVSDLAAGSPSAFGHALTSMDLLLGPRREVAVVGPEPGVEALLQPIQTRFLPNTVLAVHVGDDEAPGDVPLLRGRHTIDGRAAAYVCERFACRAPIVDVAALERELSTLGT